VSDGDSYFVSVIDAPDLTHYQPDPAFVRTWLKDPQAVRPNTAMPNLGLTETEIEALLAFLQTNTLEE
jgi:cytochrome c1